MGWWEAALLGLVQGLTEFLPVSSSGHLVIGRHVLGLAATDDVVFEVFVHFGTVMSIVAVYRREIARLVATALGAIVAPRMAASRWSADEDLRIVVFILVTLVPTGIGYVLFRDPIEAAFADPRLASGMLLVTGVLLLLTVLRKAPAGELTAWRSLAIGVAQTFAMIPGISRSGSTICAAIYLDVKPEKAANFSFLMLLPVVIGATLLKTAEVIEAGVADWVPLVLGTVVAFASGIVAIRVVLGFVRRGRLQVFAWYCFAVGALGLLFIP
jgi:undecaprenyl-diphosphatase